MERVSVVIVNYNTPDLVEACVASVRLHFGSMPQVIVVESGIEHGLETRVVQDYGIHHITTTQRLGFGQANNRGVAAADRDYLWLLNSDTLVPDQRAQSLFALLETDKRLGLVSPVLYNDRTLNERQIDFYANFQSLQTLLTRRTRPAIPWRAAEPPSLFLCDQVSAAAVATRTELFRRLGGFDESFFMYFEDDDLCYRARALGFRSAIALNVPVIHLQGRSLKNSAERKALYYRSQQRFWEKHYGRAATTLMLILRWPWRLLKES